MNSTDYASLLKIYSQQLLKALEHYKYSYKKVKNLSFEVGDLSNEDLETWEGFVARFARVSAIFLAKYLRTKVLYEDPGFSGTMRDLLNWSEKNNLIDSSDDWIAIRELRNMQAHEYADDKLSYIFKSVYDVSQTIFDIENKI